MGRTILAECRNAMGLTQILNEPRLGYVEEHGSRDRPVKR
jgi:hypothetical protein